MPTSSLADAYATCATPPEDSDRAVIPSPTPAGILAPLIYTARESALNLAAGVQVDVAAVGVGDEVTAQSDSSGVRAQIIRASVGKPLA